MAKTISLDFKGYRRDKNIDSMQNIAGIYLVYVCTPNDNDTITVHKLIYIGESEKVRDRIKNHEKRPEWKKHVGEGDELCYSRAPITNPDRERAEAALIFYRKPPVNDEYKDSFPFEETTVKSTGDCKFIPASFTVKKTE